MPVKVVIAFPDKNGLTYAQITKKGQLTITIPQQVSTIVDRTKLIPIDEILKRLSRRHKISVAKLTVRNAYPGLF